MERLRRLRDAVESVALSDVLSGGSPPTATAAVAAAPAPSATSGGSGVVRLRNLVDGEVLPYSLCLLDGTAPPSAAAVCVAVGDAPAATFPAVGGVWKGAVDLAAGANRLTLSLPPAAGGEGGVACAGGGSGGGGGGGGRSDDGGATTLTLTYDAAADGAGAPGTKSVRLVWLSTADGDGSFEVPPAPHAGWDVPHGAADGAARLRTAGRLMQAATAEMMARHGLGRRTFRLAEGVTHLTLAGLSTAAAHRTGGHELWSTVYAAADGCARRDDYIDVAVMSFTSWDAAARQARAHTALGGGRLGLFGGSAVWSWPATAAAVGTTFTDARPVDGAACLDDGGRGRVWALAATTIGAALHELGHCLSLPHPCLSVAADRGGGIMARGFDHLNRLVAVTEGGRPLRGASDEPFWDRGCAVRLRWHPWMAGVGRRPPPGGSAQGGEGGRPAATTAHAAATESGGGSGGLLDRALRAQRRLYDATPAVPMPAHRTRAVAVPTPPPITLDDLSRAIGGILNPSSSAAAAAASAAPASGSDGAVVVLPAAGSGNAPAGRGPLFTAAPDGRLTIRVGRDSGCGRRGGRGGEAGLGHIGYYVNGDNAGHEEWTVDPDDAGGEGEAGGGGGAAPPPAAVLLPPPAALRSRLGAKAGDRLSVAAIDTAGNMASWDY